jgi:hypothetical protein
VRQPVRLWSVGLAWAPPSLSFTLPITASERSCAKFIDVDFRAGVA